LTHNFIGVDDALLIHHICAGARSSAECTPNDKRSITVAVAGYTSAARGRGGLSGAFVRRHEFVRHTCQARDDYAEGYPVGKTNTRSLGWVGMNAVAQDTMDRDSGASGLFISAVFGVAFELGLSVSISWND
jgi:hypothetical protein